MMRKLLAIGAALAALAFPALADPGPHHDQSASQLLTHVLTDGFHVGHIVAVVALGLAGLGVWSVIRSALSGFRR